MYGQVYLFHSKVLWFPDSHWNAAVIDFLEVLTSSCHPRATNERKKEFLRSQNTTDLLQVVNFTDLLPLVIQDATNLSISSSCNKSDIKSGLLQLVICRLVRTCSKPVDNKFWQSTCNKSVDNLQPTCRQQAVASYANASWYRLVDQVCCKTSTCIFLTVWTGKS